MARLTKAQSKAHQQAEALLRKETLTLDEKIFVYENWHESAEHDSARSGAFFTPLEFANDFKIEVHGPKILDLCAGTGVLSFCYAHFRHHDRPVDITCVEINPDYVRIGRKLLPEANWICADIFDIWRDLPRDFDSVIGNPPFGRVMTDRKAPRYTGAECELKILDIASHLATYGTFILPQSSTPFRFSGVPYYRRVDNAKFDRFFADTRVDIEAGCGIDTTVHREGWKQVNILTEIACCEFPRVEAQSAAAPAPVVEQLSLFETPA
jgi:SAM-dependent methyltransferase